LRPRDVAKALIEELTLVAIGHRNIRSWYIWVKIRRAFRASSAKLAGGPHGLERAV
jgi:hypothetical protein